MGICGEYVVAVCDTVAVTGPTSAPPRVICTNPHPCAEHPTSPGMTFFPAAEWSFDPPWLRGVSLVSRPLSDAELIRSLAKAATA